MQAPLWRRPIRRIKGEKISPYRERHPCSPKPEHPEAVEQRLRPGGAQPVLRKTGKQSRRRHRASPAGRNLSRRESPFPLDGEVRMETGRLQPGWSGGSHPFRGIALAATESLGRAARPVAGESGRRQQRPQG